MPEKYSQLEEEKIILDYFGTRIDRFLDVGANDGITMSNTRRLAELGWSGVCVEPDSRAFTSLVTNYRNNSDIKLINVSIGEMDGLIKFTLYEDSLLSSSDIKQREIWNQHKILRDVLLGQITWDTLFNAIGNRFGLISIDVEGNNNSLLQRFPFGKVFVEMICVEYDTVEPKKAEEIMCQNGFQLIYKGINGIYVKRGEDRRE